MFSVTKQIILLYFTVPLIRLYISLPACQLDVIHVKSNYFRKFIVSLSQITAVAGCVGA